MHTRSVVIVTGTLLGFSAFILSALSAQAAGSSRHPVIIAHRGASAHAPENTLAAADMAAVLGVTWMESDVQRTKDGKLVMFHDTTLRRTTDVRHVFPDRAPWKVSDFTLGEIKQLDAGSWFSSTFAGEQVPTLEEYLDAVRANQQSLLLEIKKPELYPDIEHQVLVELRKKGWLNPDSVENRLVIQSFDADSVKTVHALAPEVKTGFLGKAPLTDLPEYAKFTDHVNPRYTTVTTDYVAAVHSLKGSHGKPLKLYAWTVDKGPDAKRMAGMGVDGIISNAPDVVRKAVQEDSDDPCTAWPSASGGTDGSLPGWGGRAPREPWTWPAWPPRETPCGHIPGNQ